MKRLPRDIQDPAGFEATYADPIEIQTDEWGRRYIERYDYSRIWIKTPKARRPSKKDKEELESCGCPDCLRALGHDLPLF